MELVNVRDLFRRQDEYVDQTIASGDQWCVHIHEIPLLEKFMDCTS